MERKPEEEAAAKEKRGCCSVAKLCPTLRNPRRTVARQAPLSKRFPRQEYRSGWPFPSPWDLPNPGIEPGSPALQADSLPLSHLGSPKRAEVSRANF